MGFVLLVAAGLIGFVLAGPVTITGASIFLSTSQVPNCLDQSSIDFEYEITASSTIISAVQISDITSDCDEEYLSLQFLDNGGVLLDEIIWYLELDAGDSTFTAIADRTTTSSSNTSIGTVSVRYPTSQTDPEGMELGLLASSVESVNFQVLLANRAALD